MAALSSFAVSLPSGRLRGDYFAIATFGFQMILFNVFNNWVDLTRGPFGISAIPGPTVLGWSVKSQGNFVLLAAGITFSTYLVAARILQSPFGRVLRAIREDELFARALGKNTMRFKVIICAFSAALAALAGSLYAHYITYVDPTSFTITESIFIISIVIIGGAGSKWGPLVGAVALVTLPEILRFIGLPSSAAANLRQVFYGAMLVIILMFRPEGLLRSYHPRS